MLKSRDGDDADSADDDSDATRPAYQAPSAGHQTLSRFPTTSDPGRTLAGLGVADAFLKKDESVVCFLPSLLPVEDLRGGIVCADSNALRPKDRRDRRQCQPRNAITNILHLNNHDGALSE